MLCQNICCITRNILVHETISRFAQNWCSSFVYALLRRLFVNELSTCKHKSRVNSSQFLISTLIRFFFSSRSKGTQSKQSWRNRDGLVRSSIFYQVHCHSTKKCQLLAVNRVRDEFVPIVCFGKSKKHSTVFAYQWKISVFDILIYSKVRVLRSKLTIFAYM